MHEGNKHGTKTLDFEVDAPPKKKNDNTVIEKGSQSKLTFCLYKFLMTAKPIWWCASLPTNIRFESKDQIISLRLICTL